jgi:hypothetical protein
MYLMHIAGKQLDTRAKAEEIYNELQDSGIAVLFDDRDDGGMLEPALRRDRL